jgi:transcription antitermination factor NusG
MEAPLFPNYVFVQVAPKDLWTALTVTGVVRYVTFNGAPAVVRDAEVDLVKKMMASQATLSNEAFGVNGEKVRVTEGPLAGLTGRVVNKKGLTKLYVELETVRQTLSVEIDAALLSRVQEGGGIA